MFGVDSDDGFEEEAPQRIDAAAGPATVERRLDRWDALARTLSDDEEDGATDGKSHLWVTGLAPDVA